VGTADNNNALFTRLRHGLGMHKDKFIFCNGTDLRIAGDKGVTVGRKVLSQAG
jgi:hypothetical protein